VGQDDRGDRYGVMGVDECDNVGGKKGDSTGAGGWVGEN